MVREIRGEIGEQFVTEARVREMVLRNEEQSPLSNCREMGQDEE